MNILSATFLCSSQKVTQCPTDERREFAFIGRSNVGKSSLINMLTGRPGLAKVSGTPGKTRLINHFIINDQWALVDLPGYGYAKVSRRERSGFSSLITDYVLNRTQLYYLFVLVDSRHEPQRIDLEFIRFLGTNGVPFGIVFTKADKLSQAQLNRNIALYGQRLREEWEELPQMFVTSSEKGRGRDEILDFIENCLEQS
ncbi:MAG TPA: ribosome biogenesis GTP-binding protein YihA/YsxC [Candidatus Rikenella faecigallinarum]|uniref:Probable GTP-binding protein EngB n=1 Tax=Candidatus Rikenella faecigallinarum TaxID=2838745 RepID=A0A9D1QCM8_9BACT|nr:ribosome biogenesis GTP-binding protein YihA/YsxC [Candidatus Rikenella faecigallinarum]